MKKLLSYELGYKATINDTLQLNVAAYYYDYRDMQVLVDFLSEAGIPLSEIVNVDKAEIKGLEVESIWLATENLALMANYNCWLVGCL